MENEALNLNTESNDIAGNRIDGPLGNTAARHTAPGAGVGIPGGPPHTGAPNPGTPDISSPGAPASSESLADAETGVGQGAVEANPRPQENKEADPADLTPGDTYGGNFSNSTQDSYRDQARRDNQDSDPNRGEFGVQSQQGTTHGGFGNQFREGITEHQGPADAQYYGEGNVRPGSGDLNAYRTYDGRDERPDTRSEYGFERGPVLASAPGGPAAGSGQVRGSEYAGPNGDNRNQPDRADANSARQVDNGSAQSPTDTGFAPDYGHTSLRGTADSSAQPTGEHRNQTEDYLPTPGGTDKQGRPDAHNPSYAAHAPAAADDRGERPASSLGYADRGREQPRQAPDFATGDDRNGYVQEQANRGDAGQGVGSRGGSYNDAYDDSQPGSNAGSPAQGEQRSEDRAQNYGQQARQENRSAQGDDEAADHGAPRRNAGRDGEADE
ncbi:hypothetical protein JAO73_22730 [Hymenobacter sp. BT523]|uniref:hypothetical protein n=1 Tax=Hymenobacter sp. BT523 TaxID=2795725 RepID=UPI0018EBB3C1|nr:hypothetical protein [Hymenobacter sp. BT523]MBJ6111853.1 hypothetical protein [Hymenobacter sp. BT523]